jgi:SAM-dependent methyltransferase
VLELACGPGVNFPLLERAIGTSGRLTALDYSQEMLAAARERARGEDWHNVEFVQGDAARTELPAESFDAALCILGLSVIPDHQAAIARVLAALKGGGRFVVLDGRPGPLGGRAGCSTRRSNHCSGMCTTPTSRRISFETWSEPSMRWPWRSSTVGACSSPPLARRWVLLGRAAHDQATKGEGDGGPGVERDAARLGEGGRRGGDRAPARGQGGGTDHASAGRRARSGRLWVPAASATSP